MWEWEKKTRILKGSAGSGAWAWGAYWATPSVLSPQGNSLLPCSSAVNGAGNKEDGVGRQRRSICPESPLGAESWVFPSPLRGMLTQQTRQRRLWDRSCKAQPAAKCSPPTPTRSCKWGLWEHINAHSCPHLWRLFSHYNARVVKAETTWLTKLKHAYSLALYRKSLPTPAPEGHLQRVHMPARGDWLLLQGWTPADATGIHACLNKGKGKRGKWQSRERLGQ